MKIEHLLKRLLCGISTSNNSSVGIVDQATIGEFVNNPSNTFLVSFPRTGSHWLRMIIELYFERPLLTRTFYFFDRNDYLLLHTHDMDLQVERKNIIYLYRNPVDTIYSQLRYYQESPKDKLRILHWTERYACHVAKWLIEEEFITHKTVIRYESLKSDIFNEFRKVIEHFGGDYDHRRLEACVAQVTKEEVKRKSTYISQVMTIGREYQDQREKFRTEQSEFVWNIIRGVSAVLYDDKNVLVNLFPSAAQDYEGIQHSIHNEQRTC